jgi:hypothetical protein
VRQGRSPVDPFAFGAPPGTCRQGQSLWRPELREALAYKARSVLNTGFAAQPLAIEAIDAGPQLPTPQSAVLLAYARAIGLKAGDVQTVTLKGPDGAVLASSTAQPLPRDQAQSMVFAGVRRPAAGWAKGRYTGDYVVREGGRTVLAQTFAFTL